MGVLKHCSNMERMCDPYEMFVDLFRNVPVENEVLSVRRNPWTHLNMEISMMKL